MGSNDAPRPNPESDLSKPPATDRLRNDKARWKDHDQPDDPRDNRPDPENDYPGARESVPR
ncbi:hypothetical protein [Pseudoxanthomonas koreensis]|uniref:hypothetical protein n=1 Tax=Pseudoxanthomonas koreensis TaxID=266061 RepID=UPI001391E302|nr:hypothetical protein [Pseudoxanthomonas koreensis]KAF1690292.1 hypothetical protein CSC64_11605 [Pseudoxanthomonas koreensis]